MDKTLNLKAGYLCNNDCLFCAQSNNRELGNPNFEDLVKEINLGVIDCNKIVFTGGEPTTRKDLIQLITYAKDLGFERIQLQSNIRKLKSIKYCKELIAAGINEFAPSLHGHTAQLHNLHTNKQKSFNDTITALENLNKLNQYVLMNTVITKLNYMYLEEIADLLISKNVSQVQFAFVHAVASGELNADLIMPSYTESIPYIHSVIEKVINNSKVKIMIESIPFCLIGESRKEYCSEFYMPDIVVRDTHYIDLVFENTRKTKFKAKSDKCIDCVYTFSCEGVWREYFEKFGEHELKPIREIGK